MSFKKEIEITLVFLPSTGRLVSGDCKKNIHVWEPREGGASWKIDQRPFSSHSKSVEDLQWSPTEATVRMSAVRLWVKAAVLRHGDSAQWLKRPQLLKATQDPNIW